MDFIESIKAIPIVDYAERMGFSPVRMGNRYYSLREHDSVRISIEKNCFWRNSRYQYGEKGAAGSIIDFAMEFCGYDRRDAIRELARMYNIQPDTAGNMRAAKPPVQHRVSQPEVKAKKPLDLPPRAADDKAVFRYLCRERKIDVSVIRYFLAKGLLYQDERNNCVFATDKFACKRSTGGKKFAIDVSGCDYDECFFICPSEKVDTIFVAESVIDIMSIMSQLAKEGKRYTQYCYLALAGVSKLPSLFYHLRQSRGLKNVVLSLDNDEGGNRATAAAEDWLLNNGFNGRYAVAMAPSGKDWNEYIQSGAKDVVLSPIINRVKPD